MAARGLPDRPRAGSRARARDLLAVRRRQDPRPARPRDPGDGARRADGRARGHRRGPRRPPAGAPRGGRGGAGLGAGRRQPRGARAIAGELVAAEARRRGLAGIVIDGWCRDVAGLRALGLPVFARGSTPASGTARDPRGFDEGAVALGGVAVRPGDVVLGDDDGLAVATPDQLRVALAGAEEIERAEAAVLAGLGQGRSLAEQTTIAEHRAARAAGRESSLGFTV
ncbi:RraA family protein [Actinomycetospora sp. CA-053990]|uniref:RraA family protein n=1 Tax=Actinomycetospora sp. CA-053990 TaxID=3239891 RepID=UPI003D8C43C7